MSRRTETRAELLFRCPAAHERIDAADLSARAKRVAKVIVNWSLGEGLPETHALQKHIAERAVVDETDVADVIRELQTAGMLAVRGRKGAPRLYTFLPTGGLVEPVALLSPERAAAIDAEVRALNAAGPGMEPVGPGAAQKLMDITTSDEALAEDLARMSRDRLASAPVGAAFPPSRHDEASALRSQIEQSFRQAGWSEADITASSSVPTENLGSVRVGESPSRGSELVKHQVGYAAGKGRARTYAGGESLADRQIGESSESFDSGRSGAGLGNSPATTPRSFRDPELNFLWDQLELIDRNHELDGDNCRHTWLSRFKRWPKTYLNRGIAWVKEDLQGGKAVRSPLAYAASKAQELARKAGQAIR